MERLKRLMAELGRRRVVRALVAWGLVTFAVLQIYEPVMHGLHLPEWTLSFVVVVLGLGFPATLVLAWMFDLRSGGIERTPSAPEREEIPTAGRPTGGTLAGDAATGGIAVLPFANLSSDKEQEYFSDGIAEEILNALAQVEGLRVIGRTSSFSMKGRNEDLRAIGQRLGVANLLEGSVRKAGSRVRITAQLIEAAGGTHRWSREFDRELTDVFAVQDEIAQAVVAALRIKLLPPARVGHATAIPVAHDQYLLGLTFLARGSVEAYGRAVRALGRSVELDPAYAPAWAALARARYWTADQDPQGDPKVEWPRAMAEAEQAITLAPHLADGYFTRALLRQFAMQDWTGAGADLERARALNPGSPGILLQHGTLLAALGRLEEAVSALEEAAALDPLAAEIQSSLAEAHLGTGKLDLAAAAATRALAVSPEHGRAARSLGFALLLQRRYEEASAAFHRSSPALYVYMGEVMIAHAQGRAEESRRGLDAILALPYVLLGSYQVAQIHAWRGEVDHAFEWLDHAVEGHDGGLTHLKYDPILRDLRGDPRFPGLLRRLNLPLS
jgi:serine/threonine-protein kinase